MAEGDALDQTQYIQRRVYTDPSLPPFPLDIHSASALGNYECVQEAISSKRDINCRNRGERLTFSRSLAAVHNCGIGHEQCKE